MNSPVVKEPGANHSLYRAAVAADEAFSAALIAAYGKAHATEMRYAPTTHHSERPDVLAAIERKHAADAAWMASMRHGCQDETATIVNGKWRCNCPQSSSSSNPLEK